MTRGGLRPIMYMFGLAAVLTATGPARSRPHSAFPQSPWDRVDPAQTLIRVTVMRRDSTPAFRLPKGTQSIVCYGSPRPSPWDRVNPAQTLAEPDEFLETRLGTSFLPLPDAQVLSAKVEERLLDRDADGFAEALEVRTILPTTVGRSAAAEVTLYGRVNGRYERVASATRPGEDIWTMTRPLITIPVCSVCSGSDSVIASFDGEKIREAGIDGPFAVRFDVWESVSESDTDRIESYLATVAGRLAETFGYLPARIVRVQIIKDEPDTLTLMATVLVDHPVELTLNGDIYEGGESHSKATAPVPKPAGFHDVELAFTRIRSETAPKTLEAGLWLDTPESDFHERRRWGVRWLRRWKVPLNR